MIVVDSHGSQLRLDGEVGRGGEGAVYSVAARPDVVAKIYHQTISDLHARKLRVMSVRKTDALLRISAWPIDLLAERPGGRVVGFLMPRISGYRPIHVLYGPKSRLSEFPEATFPFLVHTAANLARAVATVHSHGHVISDVNHDNIVVSQQAMVHLIDSDSFQIEDGGDHFLCDVGVPTHQPPEMLRLPSFHGTIRTPNQDNFGLAVLVFQLLMMRRHPFSGRFQSGGEMPIERAIGELRFAYGASAALRQMSPPPGSIPVEALSMPIVSLFERAFLVDGATQIRPTADEWIGALDGLARSLRQCARNASHSYLSALPSCPLCAVEGATGRLFFGIVRAAGGLTRAASTLDMSLVWAEISAASPPGRPPSLPSYRSLEVQVSPRLVQSGKRRRKRNTIATVMVVLGILAWVAMGVTTGFWAFAALGGIGFFVVADRGNKTRAEARRKLDAARSDWEAIQKVWNQEAGGGAYAAKQRELADAKRALDQLPANHKKRLRKLEMGRRERELKQHLDRHRLVNARIPGIGPGRKATLSSYGIDVATDVEYKKIVRIPGFGTSLASSLVAWRRQVESSFTFDPNKGPDPRDIAALDAELALARVRCEQTLATGAPALRALSASTLQARQTLRLQVDRTLGALAQAEAEWRAS